MWHVKKYLRRIDLASQNTGVGPNANPLSDGTLDIPPDSAKPQLPRSLILGNNGLFLWQQEVWHLGNFGRKGELLVQENLLLSWVKILAVIGPL